MNNKRTWLGATYAMAVTPNNEILHALISHIDKDIHSRQLQEQLVYADPEHKNHARYDIFSDSLVIKNKASGTINIIHNTYGWVELYDGEIIIMQYYSSRSGASVAHRVYADPDKWEIIPNDKGYHMVVPYLSSSEDGEDIRVEIPHHEIWSDAEHHICWLDRPATVEVKVDRPYTVGERTDEFKLFVSPEIEVHKDKLQQQVRVNLTHNGNKIQPTSRLRVISHILTEEAFSLKGGIFNIVKSKGDWIHVSCEQIKDCSGLREPGLNVFTLPLKKVDVKIEPSLWLSDIEIRKVVVNRELHYTNEFNTSYDVLSEFDKALQSQIYYLEKLGTRIESFVNNLRDEDISYRRKNSMGEFISVISPITGNDLVMILAMNEDIAEVVRGEGVGNKYRIYEYSLDDMIPTDKTIWDIKRSDAKKALITVVNQEMVNGIDLSEIIGKLKASDESITISLEDSMASGNCKTGTLRFASDIWYDKNITEKSIITKEMIIDRAYRILSWGEEGDMHRFKNALIRAMAGTSILLTSAVEYVKSPDGEDWCDLCNDQALGKLHITLADGSYTEHYPDNPAKDRKVYIDSGNDVYYEGGNK